MAVHQITRYIRPYAEAKENMLGRARGGHFEFADFEVVKGVLDRLDTLDHEAWAAAFSEAAAPFEARAEEEEARGDVEAAKQDYLRAYAYYRLARYPTTNSPGRMAAYERSRKNYLKAARWFDPPLQVIEIPFRGKPGEGDKITAYYRRPKTSERVPVLVSWGGIDGYKEERRADPYLARGVAMLAMDGAGVGQCPIKGSTDGERLWDPVFEWIAAQPDLDASRTAVWGASTGGYWAAKLAHVRKERIRCAVDHGGATHYTFTAQWIEKAQNGEYAYELAETLAYAFGQDGFDGWVEYAPKLSLLDMGLLDEPCAPMLLVNGTKDSIFPIEDMHLLLAHGDPKTAYLPEVGHMGHTPRTAGIILNWICQQLEAGR
ncbi:MAG TPA: alpha/beta hydrolase [Chloroflexota bacterium]|nr:alpha/beta hydrolase [Chloroflexota bacterium]